MRRRVPRRPDHPFPATVATPLPGGGVALALPIEVKSEPNMRGAWRVGWRRKKAQQQTVALVMLASCRLLPRLPCTVTMIRHGGRGMDDDNYPAACKAIRDQVARHYGCGDGRKSPLAWQYEQIPGGPRWLEIKIEPKGALT